jgi:muramoyltetrapeptide carboxypeptidase
MRWMTNKPSKPIRAKLIGGNLSLVAALIGTPFAESAKGKILFLEDTDEAFYRMDRMMVQLEQSGDLDGAAAIVLGDFTNCKDEDNTRLARAGSTDRVPLRKVFDLNEAMEEIFLPIASRTGVPLAVGLPVGHGPHFAPLPLGATYELDAPGKLKLLEWDWLNRSA